MTNNRASWSMEVPVISTCHIPEALSKVLNDSDPHNRQGDILFAPYPYGYFIFVGEDHMIDDLSVLSRWLNDTYPENSGWVRLDMDGDTIEGLPVYEW